MSKKTDLIRSELARIARESGGILLPKKVVDAARDEKSPLHSRFEWNNGRAAEKYRLWQARVLISVTVNIVEQTGESEQVWVSLKPDQKEAGGYRSLISVLSDKDMRAQLLQDAMQDMEIFEQKYKHLQELSEVFAAVGRARRKAKAA